MASITIAGIEAFQMKIKQICTIVTVLDEVKLIERLFVIG